jgi:hypothetical protein
VELPAAVEERRLAVAQLDRDAALVDVAMVRRTQATEVVEGGRAAVDPVRQVMAVEEASVGAAREAAGGVAPRQRSRDRGRDRARATADRERLAVGVLVEVHHAAVAGQAARGLGGDAGAVREGSRSRGWWRGDAVVARLARDREHHLDRRAIGRVAAQRGLAHGHQAVRAIERGAIGVPRKRPVDGRAPLRRSSFPPARASCSIAANTIAASSAGNTASIATMPSSRSRRVTVRRARTSSADSAPAAAPSAARGR